MNKKQIKHILEQNSFRPVKKFGQNFLTNPHIIQKIVKRVKTFPPPFVEIGPGLGALTNCFESQKKDVLLIERDKKLARRWQDKGWRLICADILKLDWGKLPKKITLFGNLPYQIAGSLILMASLRQKQIPRMIVALQKEVAQRAAAAPGAKNYGLLSVISQTFWDISLTANIPKTDFYPAPKVEGRALVFQAKNPPKLKPEPFLKFVRQCFAFKRKMLFKQMPASSPKTAKEILEKLGYSPAGRAEELKPESFVRLYFEAARAKAQL